MTQYMRYQGRAVEIYGWMTKGQRVPLLYPGDQGETLGDFAVIDGRTVVWDGKQWMPAPDVWKRAFVWASEQDSNVGVADSQTGGGLR